MKLDLDNLNPGTWFDFPDGEGRICLKTLSFDEAMEISKATSKKKAEYKNNQRFAFDEIDEERQTEMTWDKTILSWEGLYSKDKKEIPCTKEMKINLMRKSPEFARMVRGFLETLTAAETAQAEIEEKN
ncbi:MAG: hypothetical protein PHS93_07715 [Candidatus Omnitrophica bacterium]|nr:hypothetical protein [Candidatus Omnitrophota bacterium]